MSTQNANEPVDSRGSEDISVDELLYWLEFGCWTTLVLFPFLRWVNGPSVSTDQFYVRTGLVVVACVGALGLRGYKFFRKRSEMPRES